MNKELKIFGINLAVIFGTILIGSFILFNVYLPNFTQHGEMILVPDLTGMNKAELNDFLKQHSLRLEIADSLTYEKNAEPETVINQRPKAGSMVKEFRKIYVSINASNVPMVEVPLVTQISLFNATTLLQNAGLLLDTIKYKPSNDEGLVLAQEYKGSEIKEGTKIPRGSIILLTVGKKGDVIEVEVPDLLGMPLTLAETTIDELGLILGNPIWDESSNEPKGTILKQKPEPGTLQTGGFVDVWVAGSEPLEEKP